VTTSEEHSLVSEGPVAEARCPELRWAELGGRAGAAAWVGQATYPLPALSLLLIVLFVFLVVVLLLVVLVVFVVV